MSAQQRLFGLASWVIAARAWPAQLAQLWAPNRGEEPPLRAELFSAEQMALHGKALAGLHRIRRGEASDLLLRRLSANEKLLIDVGSRLKLALSAGGRIPPAGEWVVDNFYLVEEQIRTARLHLPRGYSRELPRLAGGPSAGLPRVYDIALEVVSHGDGRVDREVLDRFLDAYQGSTPLRLGELWATPIMLRLAIIENLRRVGVRIARAWDERELAAYWAEQMVVSAESEPKNLILLIADMARSAPPMASAFVAEMARLLQGRGPALALPLTWIQQYLAEAGQSIEQLVQQDNQGQAADQVSVSNSIASLRLLSALDWRSFVESHSVVERVLLRDPAAVYARMDFASRDAYRHVIEALARRSGYGEIVLAERVLALATAAAPASAGAHLGEFLLGAGRAELERLIGVRQAARAALATPRARLYLYLGAIAFGSLALAWALSSLATPRLAAFDPRLALLPVLLLVASQAVLSWANSCAAWWVAPQRLPRMDYAKGIDPQARGLVVVPCLLSSTATVETLVEALEVRFLANRDACLHFALLSDFCDADSAQMPADDALLALAQQRIAALNLKYARSDAASAFLLFHRARQWNARERTWMGHERKRGKLEALNALLCGGGGQDFACIQGSLVAESPIRYVITLDADTQLPPDAARELIGAMAHPLHQARYDANRGRVVGGYGILQPRVAIGLKGANRSRYARMLAGEPGVDPYTRTVSDVYQDLFAEGSFIGKGIYDLQALHQVLAGRLPDNQILSHDLLEGCYERAGLISDVLVYEECPSRYAEELARRHRWMRGDWQLAGWLLRRVVDPSQPTAARGRRVNPLSALSQWKLFDNLRRSLVAPAQCLLLLTAWSLLTPAWLWSALVFGLMLWPALWAGLRELFTYTGERRLGPHLWALVGSSSQRLAHAVLDLACLPHTAYCSLDAMLRSLWRMGVSRRHLLEWRPSATLAEAPAAETLAPALRQSLRLMWPAPLLALLCAAWLALGVPHALAAAAPILLLWLCAPLLTAWLSIPLRQASVALSAEQQRFLRDLARRTWGFFERFVGADDHWLPPDNYQEYRSASMAHRTSPTNMGLSLLANLAAYDFGYLLGGGLIRRCDNSLRTMEGLARYRGHFYNWYDTQSLAVLAPHYVSTVDSGNLAGHLLTLSAGLDALHGDAIVDLRHFEALDDTLRIALARAEGALAERGRSLARSLQRLRSTPPEGLAAHYYAWQQLAHEAAGLATADATEPSVATATTPGAPPRQ